MPVYCKQNNIIIIFKTEIPSIFLETINAHNSLQELLDNSPELCMLIVKECGNNLAYVKNQTDEICLEVIKQNGLAIRFVKNQTDELCLEAVKQNGLAIQFVKNQTPNICLEAVKQTPYAIQYIGEQNQTTEMLKYFFNKKSGLVYYINSSLIDKISIKYLDGSVSVSPVNKQPKNTIKYTTYGEIILIETIKTPLSITDYIRSKHENITVVDNLDKMVSPDTLYMIQLPNEQYEVYKMEKVNVVKKGWIYNTEDIESKLIKVATYELCIKQ